MTWERRPGDRGISSTTCRYLITAADHSCTRASRGSMVLFHYVVITEPYIVGDVRNRGLSHNISFCFFVQFSGKKNCQIIDWYHPFPAQRSVSDSGIWILLCFTCFFLPHFTLKTCFTNFPSSRSWNIEAKSAQLTNKNFNICRYNFIRVVWDFLCPPPLKGFYIEACGLLGRRTWHPQLVPIPKKYIKISFQSLLPYQYHEAS